MINIPKSLIDAKAAVDAALTAHAAVVAAAHKMSQTIAAATARLPILDREIDQLIGSIVADDALTGIADDLRMGEKKRAEAISKLAAMRAERADLAAQLEGSRAGSAALIANAIQDRLNDLIKVARPFVAEKAAFIAALAPELHRDLARLTVLKLFTKWMAIAEGTGMVGITGELNEIRVKFPGAGAFVYAGKYVDPDNGKELALDNLWRSDAKLVEQVGLLAAITAVDRQVAPMVRGANQARRQEEDRQRRESAEKAQRLQAAQPAGNVAARAPATRGEAPAFSLATQAA